MKKRNVDTSPHWATPPELYEKLNKKFCFDFDPCPLYSDFDGLSNDVRWGSANFINPGFDTHTKNAFVYRIIKETFLNKSTNVLLVPASMETQLFHDYIWPNVSTIRFLKSRPRFHGVNTKGVFVTNNTGQNGIMIAVFEPVVFRDIDFGVWDWQNEDWI